jgi:hypothetical protein
MAKRAAAQGAPLKSGSIVEVDIARTATAKDIHAVIDRLLNLRGCRTCGLIGKITIFDQVARPIVPTARQIAGNAAGVKVRVIG